MKWSEHLNDSFTKGQQYGRTQGMLTTVAAIVVVAAAKKAYEVADYHGIPQGIVDTFDTLVKDVKSRLPWLT
jgi:hypothetical protein